MQKKIGKSGKNEMGEKLQLPPSVARPRRGTLSAASGKEVDARWPCVEKGTDPRPRPQTASALRPRRPRPQAGARHALQNPPRCGGAPHRQPQTVRGREEATPHVRAGDLDTVWPHSLTISVTSEG